MALRIPLNPRKQAGRLFGLLLVLILSCPAGCSRRDYRLRADREVYDAIAERAHHPSWNAPVAPLERPVESRLHDPFSPDCPPMPPDDLAAHKYMHVADGRSGYRFWHARGDAPWIESPAWHKYLQKASDGTLQLTPSYAVELGLLHSRQYQFELERLYLTALALTLERFQFDLQWFARNRTEFEHFGTDGAPTESNALTSTTNFGFRRRFTTGGQLLVDFANTMVWEFAGNNSQATASTLTASLLQPLLRGAMREVQMEPLTQAERDVLYEVRNFARFRKVFYFNIVSVEDGYLQLLLQLQAIRNIQANVESLEQNLLAHEALAAAGIVSGIQVDQVFQSYQAGRLELIRSQNVFQTSLDTYKVQLGLPPNLPVSVDDSLLDAFQLSDPALEELSAKAEIILARFRSLDEPPEAAEISTGFSNLQEASRRALERLQDVEEDYKTWVEVLDERPAPADERQRARQQAMREQLGERLVEIRLEITKLQEEISTAAAQVGTQTAAESWDAIQRLSRRLLLMIQDSMVIQAQVRVQLIELPPIRFEQDEAIAIALENRLDLMNRRAEVVDEWRRITVTADALQSDLDLFATAEVATEPGSNNPLNFSAEDSRYRVGFEFDGPLNRLAERNTYRAQLIQYQRARRSFMATEDTIVQAVRFNMRQLEAERLNFDIVRERLIVAARQVEEARLQLLEPGLAGDSSKTQDVLNALNSLLGAKDALIGAWARYHSNRLQLLLDLELLQVDPRGLVLDEDTDTAAEPIATPPIDGALDIGEPVIEP